MWNNAFIFSKKKHGLQKKALYRRKQVFFAVDYVKVIELKVAHMTSHVNGVDEIADIYKTV